MGIETRSGLYAQLEEARGHPLIAYVTSSRNGASGQIASDSVNELMLQLEALPASTKEIDFLIVSNGGDPTVAWRLVSLIREKVKRFNVLVPQAAYSAATLIALGADQIVMHPHGNLGPTDPQIQSRKAKDAGGQVVPFGSEDLAAFLKFAKDDIGITNQQELMGVFKLFVDEVGAVGVGVAARSAQLTVRMGEKLLQLHMTAEADKAKARGISEKLTRDFFHHGYPVSRSEAKSIGLPIADHSAPVERLIWAIWMDFSEELQLRSKASDIEILKSNPACWPLFGPLPHIVEAPGTSQNQTPAAGGMAPPQNAVVLVPPAPFERVHALMESSRVATRFVSRGELLAARLPDQNYRISKVVSHEGWITVPVPEVKNKADNRAQISAQKSRTSGKNRA